MTAETTQGSGGARRRGSRGGRGRRRPEQSEATSEQQPAAGNAGVSRAAQKSEEKTTTTSRGPGRPTPEEPRVVGRRPGAQKAQQAPATGPNGGAPKATSAMTAPRAPARPDTRTRPGRPELATPAPAAPQTVAAPARRRRAAASAPPGDEIHALQQAIEQIGDAVAALSERLERATQRARIGIFVDVPNVLYGAEKYESRLDMGKLLDFLSEGRELVRATAYSPVSDNPAEPVERQRFVAPFVPFEYRIVTKPLKRFADGSIKGNFDVEMAIDMLTMAERLDVITCVSGDSDFARLVEVLQGRGVRVEVAAFAGSTSAEMRALADRYIDLGAVVERLLR